MRIERIEEEHSVACIPGWVSFEYFEHDPNTASTVDVTLTVAVTAHTGKYRALCHVEDGMMADEATLSDRKILKIVDARVNELEEELTTLKRFCEIARGKA